MWVLEIEAWSPARATSTLSLNLWAVSQFLFQILLTCRSSLLYFNQYTSSLSVTQWCFLIFLEFVIANVCVSICNWDCSANSWISLFLSLLSKVLNFLNPQEKMFRAFQPIISFIIKLSYVSESRSTSPSYKSYHNLLVKPRHLWTFCCCSNTLWQSFTTKPYKPCQ